VTARRVLEIRTNDRVVQAYRTVTRREIGEGGTGALAFSVPDGSDGIDWLYMNGEEVEALNQFTYEILAGPAGDPRLTVVDAAIKCGFVWQTGSWRHECCLDDGHRQPAENVDHVTSGGQTHLIEPPF
jgi:hypothetical protein